MNGWNRSVLDGHSKRPTVFVSQEQGRATAPAIDQACRPIRAQLHHPVAYDLDGDTADRGRLRAGRAVIDRGQGEQPSGLIRIRAAAGRGTQSSGFVAG